MRRGRRERVGLFDVAGAPHSRSIGIAPRVPPMHTSDTTTADAPSAAPVPSAPSAAAARRSLGARAAALRTHWTDSRAGTLALLGILLATGVLYCWNLTANGYANSFYSAAVQAGSVDWTAFFYGSSDAGNSITVDKPPASLWIMALSVRLFGLNSAAILMPQVVMGILSVFVVNRSVKRVAGEAAGLIAAAALAITPVAVLMFRFNNPDALLVLLMTLAAWATVRAIETGSIRWMTLVGVLIGFAFLTKTLQAFLVVPFVAIAFLICADTTLRRRILGTLAAGLALVVAGGWWVAIVELVPEQWRPYIGGSQTDSFLELTFGYNGLGRLSGDEVGSVGGGGGFGSGAVISRLFSSAIGGQISWLIPAALILTLGALWLGRRAPAPTRCGPRSWCGAAGSWSPRWCSPSCRESSTSTTRSPSPRRSRRWSVSAPGPCGATASRSWRVWCSRSPRPAPGCGASCSCSARASTGPGWRCSCW